MKGWKCFSADMKCLDMQYEVGKTYEMKSEPVLCKIGYHFHKEQLNIFKYYPSNSSVVCEIEALGNIVEEDDKCVTNKIKIIKKLSKQKIEKLVHINGNTGLHNSGDCNSGNRNSGDCNSGNRNSGDWNSGNRNSGDCNSGDCNSGDWNSGNRNSGNRNSGDWNSGYYNSGDWNSGDWNSGFFNTDEPTVRMFNQDTGLKLNEIDIPAILYQLNVTEFVKWEDMTPEEREENNCYVSGGYTRKIPYKEAWKNLWEKLTESEKDKVKSLPNFDAKIFKEITGITI